MVAVRNRVVQLSQIEINNEIELSSVRENLVQLMQDFHNYCQIIEEDCKKLSLKDSTQLTVFKILDNMQNRLIPENILLYLSQIINFLCIKASNI